MKLFEGFGYFEKKKKNPSNCCLEIEINGVEHLRASFFIIVF